MISRPIEIGEKFNRLTVVSKLHKPSEPHLHSYVHTCKCDCGNLVEIRPISLLSGARKSCGCINHPNIVGMKFGRLTGIAYAGIKINNGIHERMFKCRCDCGKEITLSFRQLSSKIVKSCGCIKHPDLIGKRFGRLVVIGLSSEKDKYSKRLFNCRCDCGKEVIVPSGNLLGGNTKSCGCLRDEVRIKWKSIEEKILRKRFSGMITRCYNPNKSEYARYGGRGITICDEWLNDPKKFVEWSLKNGFRQGLTIDRIDNNGPYSPENCRWTSITVQNNNRRTCHYLEIDGKKRSVTDWSRSVGMPPSVVLHMSNAVGDEYTANFIKSSIISRNEDVNNTRKILSEYADKFFKDLQSHG